MAHETLPTIDQLNQMDDLTGAALYRAEVRQIPFLYRNQEPLHSDVMDLIGHANVSMLEAIPFALRADDPISYLMTVSAAAMRRYCAYKDPLIERSSAVQSLSRQYQRVLIAAHGLFGHPTMKNQDIADMMGLPKETVEKYLWRARRRLAAKLVPSLTQRECKLGSGVATR